MTQSSIKLHLAVARALAENGVDTLFGLMGDANLYVANSFVRDCAGTYIAAAHEAGAAMMALGYALMSGRVGVCTVTHGPAMTNTITALVEGVKGSVPMVVVCGDTAVEDRDNLQNVAQREFAIASGAGFEQLRSPKTAVRDVATALRRAIVERRPVVLNMPVEFQWSDVEYQPITFRIPNSRAIVSSSQDLDSAIGIIAAAKRPMILAGRGAQSPEGKSALLQLAKRLDAPLATTLKAKDLFAGEDFNLGICGTLSTPVAVDTIMKSDCILAFGASLNKYTVSNGTFLQGKRIIQVNLEPTEVGKNIQPHAGLVGDPAQMADLIVHWLDEAEIPGSQFCTDELKQAIAADAFKVGKQAAYDNGTIDISHALQYLDRTLPADRVLVTDGGRFMRVAWAALKTRGMNSFLTTINFGSIGLGLPHAIGASFAMKGRPVVLVTGDGGFMHGGLVEFNTAVRCKTDLVVVVCNDSAYGAEHIRLRNKQMDPSLLVFNWPDFAPLAIALGGQGVTVRSPDDFTKIDVAIRERTAPLLIDLKIDPDRMPQY